MQLREQLKGLGLYFLPLLVLVPLDQITKFWVRTNFYVGESRPPEGFFRLTYLQNTGASFGIFQDGATFFTIFSTISLLVMLAVIVLMRRMIPFLDTKTGKIAMGLVSAGTLGNLIDRYNLGFVVDFINFSFWPTFNVADSAIVVGALLLAFLILVNYKDL
ncbi:MAG: signal peptidase II [Dehalococcoidales bacterium]|nr:signal peptidase II [Dehalococcoidales bacterium]MDD3264797.1 signal peptidase II [Dehalococcoidales bacterium]MDD4322260.1 signal peptidase II [Dehalococcoidales bacterium]MDD4794370.1 signal peptidase II [Dehalococcoidales bacterium]MDD5122050.1 signal peptidase II [Dehalococcoidales bacterium]